MEKAEDNRRPQLALAAFPLIRNDPALLDHQGEAGNRRFKGIFIGKRGDFFPFILRRGNEEKNLIPAFEELDFVSEFPMSSQLPELDDPPAHQTDVFIKLVSLSAQEIKPGDGS